MEEYECNFCRGGQQIEFLYIGTFLSRISPYYLLLFSFPFLSFIICFSLLHSSLSSPAILPYIPPHLSIISPLHCYNCRWTRTRILFNLIQTKFSCDRVMWASPLSQLAQLYTAGTNLSLVPGLTIILYLLQLTKFEHVEREAGIN